MLGQWAHNALWMAAITVQGFGWPRRRAQCADWIAASI